MSDQPEALRLADWLDGDVGSGLTTPKDCAAELRRLHEENKEMLEALKVASKAIREYRSQGAPTAYWDDVEAQAYAAIKRAEEA